MSYLFFMFNVCNKLYYIYPNAFSVVNKKDRLTFLTVNFGKNQIENIGYIRKFLTALSYSVPMSNLIIGISPNSNVSSSFNNIPINIEFLEFKELQPFQDVVELYKGKLHWKYYYAGMRYLFYKKYLQKNTDVKYVMLTDLDNLILKNPFDLFIKEPKLIHVMEDYKKFGSKNDINTKWFNAFNSLSKEIKNKCQMKPIVNNSQFHSKIPLNAGTLIGKNNFILILCTLMSKAFNCTGVIYNGGEQGLFNYLYYSGKFSDAGLNFKKYSVYSSMLSCPNYLSLDAFAKVAPKLYTIHHYSLLNSKYQKILGTRIVDIINLHP